MRILLQDTKTGKKYKLKTEVISFIVDFWIVFAILSSLILGVSYIQNLSILWGVATW